MTEDLATLFSAIFETEESLRRFLALTDLTEVVRDLPRTKGSTPALAARLAANAIEERGLVGEAIFDALRQIAPHREQDIAAVAETYGLSDRADDDRGPDSPDDARPGPDEAVSPELHDFVRQLQSTFDGMSLVDPVDQALDATNWPWTAAASVLGEFEPRQLRPVPPADPSMPASRALADSVYVSLSGTWVLEDRLRAAALRRLADDGLIEDALAANSHLIDRRRDWVKRLLDGNVDGLARLTTDEIRDLDVVMGWLGDAGFGLPLDHDTVVAAIERRSLIDPLRALVGRHFRGRQRERDTIDDHIAGRSDGPILALRGPGGVGKSTLIGYLLLGLEELVTSQPISFAYVDFDRRENDPRRPRQLVEQIARQLRLLYATSVGDRRDFALIEAASSGDIDGAYAADVLDIGSATDVESLVAELSRGLAAIARPGTTPLLLVLDTFEEVQMLGPGPVADVLELVDLFLAHLPDARVVVSGRAEVHDLDSNPIGTELALGDLDDEAAEAVLEALGVGPHHVRRMIVTTFGGDPLTLRLAAEAVERVGSPESALADIDPGGELVSSIARERVQGILYGRILGHIKDPAVQAVAHPGLAVRRVDTEVLREVLAEPCELDPDLADELMERLQREVSLFYVQADGSVVHRGDIRRMMMRTIMDDPTRAEVVSRIHRRAIDYYSALGGDVAAAEETYHRLVLGEDPRSFTRPWTTAVSDSLASALEERLPPVSERWLRRRLGLADGTDRNEWEQVDWELDARSRAASLLGSERFEAALEVLEERDARLPASPLYALAAEALIGLGRLDEADAVLDEGTVTAVEAGDRTQQLALAQQRIRLATASADPSGIVESTRACTRLLDTTDDEALRAIDILVDSIEALQHLDHDALARELSHDLTARFDALSLDDLSEQPYRVNQVLRATGHYDDSALVRAASELGDRFTDDRAPFREDAFALERLLEQVQDSGQPALGRLAAEVGLTNVDWTVRELARSATRTGRVGSAIVLGLDHASDPAVARDLVVENLLTNPRWSS